MITKPYSDELRAKFPPEQVAAVNEAMRRIAEGDSDGAWVTLAVNRALGAWEHLCAMFQALRQIHGGEIPLPYAREDAPRGWM